MKLKGIIIGVVVGVLSAGFLTYVTWFVPTSPVLGGEFSISTSSEVTNFASDLLGTHVGTSTIGIDKNGGATTTYIKKIGRGITMATYQFKVTAATSTNSLTFAVYGSNDFNCATNLGDGAAATNTVMNNINWYVASDHLLNKVHSTTLTNSSTMILWSNATVGAGATLILDRLNFECLRLDVSGLSTTVYGGLTTK